MPPPGQLSARITLVMCTDGHTCSSTSLWSVSCNHEPSRMLSSLWHNDCSSDVVVHPLRSANVNSATKSRNNAENDPEKGLMGKREWTRRLFIRSHPQQSAHDLFFNALKIHQRKSYYSKVTIHKTTLGEHRYLRPPVCPDLTSFFFQYDNKRHQPSSMTNDVFYGLSLKYILKEPIKFVRINRPRKDKSVDIQKIFHRCRHDRIPVSFITPKQKTKDFHTNLRRASERVNRGPDTSALWT